MRAMLSLTICGGFAPWARTVGAWAASARPTAVDSADAAISGCFMVIPLCGSRSETILRFGAAAARLQVRCKNSFLPMAAWLVYVNCRDQETPYVPGAARTPIVVDAGGFIGR